MAQAKSADDGGMTKKTVTVVGYARNNEYRSERAMVDALDSERDHYERQRNKTRDVHVVHTDANGDETEAWIPGGPVREELLKHGVASGNLEVRETVEVKRPYRHTPGSYVNDVRNRLAVELPDELTGGLERSLWKRKWQDDERVTRVEVKGGNVDYRRVLVHQSDRGGRRKYETDHKRLSMSFTIELGPASEGKVDAWSEEVVVGFVRELAREEWVDKVRVTDCKETVEREGDCFDL